MSTKLSQTDKATVAPGIAADAVVDIDSALWLLIPLHRDHYRGRMRRGRSPYAKCEEESSRRTLAIRASSSVRAVAPSATVYRRTFAYLELEFPEEPGAAVLVPGVVAVDGVLLNVGAACGVVFGSGDCAGGIAEDGADELGTEFCAYAAGSTAPTVIMQAISPVVILFRNFRPASS